MNTIDFTQTGGFPFDQGTLAFLQDSIYNAAKTANLGGPLCILSGCVQSGGNVSDGVVVINGEILPFQGGAIDTKVIVVETTTDLLYEDNVSRPVKKVRYATFGDDGIQNNPWTDFKRNTTEGVLARLERLERIAAPFLPVGAGERGGMVLWKKPANLIPAGWAEVVDWRRRLAMGYDPDDPDFDTVGEAGGGETATLVKANMPSDLTVEIPVASTDSGTGAFDEGSTGGGTRSINLGGSSQPFSILNPFRIAIFIEYIGS